MSSYDRELVELLVPTIWDRDYSWGMVDQRKPDPDMPKSANAKNQGNTLWAHLADIRRAYQGAFLSYEERVALVLVGGMGMTQRLAAWYSRCAQSTMTERYDRAIGRLCDYLNGTEHQDFDYAEYQEGDAA